MVAEATPTGFSTIGYQYFIVYACINLFLTLPCESNSMNGFLDDTYANFQ